MQAIGSALLLPLQLFRADESRTPRPSGCNKLTGLVLHVVCLTSIFWTFPSISTLVNANETNRTHVDGLCFLPVALENHTPILD